MRVVDEANTEARRATIISAAVRCLARQGVARTSIADICKEAGMRSGHLYYYFESKDDLLISILLMHQERQIESIEHMLEEDRDLFSQIIDIHVENENYRASTGLTPVLRMELECYVGRLGIVLGHDERMRESLRGAIRRAAERGLLPGDIDVERFANGIVLIWQGITHSRVSPGFDLDETRKSIECLLAPWSRKTA
jgi:AcrR family transcriptional regulator